MLINKNRLKWLGILSIIIILIISLIIISTLYNVEKEFEQTLAPGEKFSKKTTEYLKYDYINFEFKILRYNNDTIQFWIESKDDKIYNKEIISDDLTHELWFLVPKDGRYSLFWENTGNTTVKISVKCNEPVNNVYLDLTMVIIVILLIGAIVFAVIFYIKERRKKGAQPFKKIYILIGIFVTVIIFFTIAFVFSLVISNVEKQKQVILTPGQQHNETFKKLLSNVGVDYHWQIKEYTNDTIDFWVEDDNGFKYDFYSLANGEGRSSEFIAPDDGDYTFIWKSNCRTNVTIDIKLINDPNQNLHSIFPLCFVIIIPLIIIFILLTLYYIKSLVSKVFSVMFIIFLIFVLLITISVSTTPWSQNYDILVYGNEITLGPGENYTKSYNDITKNDYISYNWVIKDCQNETIRFWIQGENGIKYHDSLGNKSQTAFIGEFNPPHNGDYDLIWINTNSNGTAVIVYDTSQDWITSDEDLCCVVLFIPLIVMLVLVYFLFFRRKKRKDTIEEGVVYHKPEYYNPYFNEQLRDKQTSEDVPQKHENK